MFDANAEQPTVADPVLEVGARVLSAPDLTAARGTVVGFEGEEAVVDFGSYVSRIPCEAIRVEFLVCVLALVARERGRTELAAYC